MLWLGAGLWSYIHNVYTSINPTIGKALFRKLKLVVFAPVQTQKMTSYVRGLIVTGLKPRKLAVVILGTGFEVMKVVSVDKIISDAEEARKLVD